MDSPHESVDKYNRGNRVTRGELRRQRRTSPTSIVSQRDYTTNGETATTDSASSTPNSERYKAFAQLCNQPMRIVNQLPLDITMKMLNQTEHGKKIRSAVSVTSSAEDESKDEVTTEDSRFSATSRVKPRVSVCDTFFPGVSLQEDSTVKASLSGQTSEEPV